MHTLLANYVFNAFFFLTPRGANYLQTLEVRVKPGTRFTSLLPIHDADHNRSSVPQQAIIMKSFYLKGLFFS